MLSLALRGWMMSKLLSLKVAKLSLPPCPTEGWAEDISWHYADETVSLRTRASLCVDDFFFFLVVFIILTFSCSRSFFLSFFLL